MNLSCYFSKRGQGRVASFCSPQGNPKHNNLLVSLQISKDKSTSYCKFSRKQMVGKQECLKKLSTSQATEQHIHHLHFLPKNNQQKHPILTVTPAVMYQSLRNKKINQRNRNKTEPTNSPELSRAQTQNWKPNSTAKSPVSTLKSFHKTKWTDLRKTTKWAEFRKSTIDPEAVLQDQSDKRPCTAQASSNRLRTLHNEIPCSKVELSDKLRGWQTRQQLDDL